MILTSFCLLRDALFSSSRCSLNWVYDPLPHCLRGWLFIAYKSVYKALGAPLWWNMPAKCNLLSLEHSKLCCVNYISSLNLRTILEPWLIFSISLNSQFCYTILTFKKASIRSANYLSKGRKNKIIMSSLPSSPHYPKAFMIETPKLHVFLESIFLFLIMVKIQSGRDFYS